MTVLQINLKGDGFALDSLTCEPPGGQMLIPAP
jgi:hypothetical protein